MSRTISFSKIKDLIKSNRFIKTKKDFLLTLLVLILQVLSITFGVFLRGFGTPVDLERKAQIYTSTNKKTQTYSLIYHRSDYPLSYLDYHMKMVEENRDMINGGCKIFFTNSIDLDKSRSPFSVSIDEDNVQSAIAFLSNTSISLESYFNFKSIIGSFSIKENEIIISEDYADKIAKILGVSEKRGLVGKTIINDTDNQVYTINGIFDIGESFLSNYYSHDLVIGHFNNFSKIAINPRIGFVTSKMYLENLFFLYRISVFIDPPSYGRNTVVSTNGNDFDTGGNTDLTNKIYYTGIKEANFAVILFTWVFMLSSILCTLYFYMKKFDNKKCVRVFAISSVFLGCFSTLIAYLINNKALNNIYSPYLGILSGLFTFAYLIVFVILCFVLESNIVNRNHYGVASNDNYYIINI